jgi:nucleoid-associated protein YgaU
MLTTHDPITTRDHLIDLARVLTEADGQDPPDPARVGQLAWQILAELNEAAFGRIDAEALLAQAQTAARAAAAAAARRAPAPPAPRPAAADAVSGSPDPLSHIRRLLAAQGGMPPAGTAATTILAWPGGRSNK